MAGGLEGVAADFSRLVSRACRIVSPLTSGFLSSGEFSGEYGVNSAWLELISFSRSLSLGVKMFIKKGGSLSCSSAESAVLLGTVGSGN